MGLLVDLRQPHSLHDVIKTLRPLVTQHSKIYAASPLAWYLIEKLKKELPRELQLIDLHQEIGFSPNAKDSLQNTYFLDALRTSLSHETKLPHLAFDGLFYDLFQILEYFTKEAHLFEFCTAKNVRVFTDLNPDCSREMIDNNRTSVAYNLISPHHVIRFRKLDHPFFNLPFLKLKAKKFLLDAREHMGAVFRANSRSRDLPILFGKTLHDTQFFLGSLAQPAEPRYRLKSPEDFYKCFDKFDSAADLEDANLENILNDLSKSLPEVLRKSAILPTLGQFLKSEIKRYLKVLVFAETELAKRKKNTKILGYLSTGASTYQEFCLSYTLKKSGYPTVFFQHGGYFNESRGIIPMEISPGTHAFYWGTQDADNLRKYESTHQSKVFAAGSIALSKNSREKLSRRPHPPKKVTYFLDILNNNTSSNWSPWSNHSPSQISTFERVTSIISLFKKFPNLTLQLKPHPWIYATYAPYLEWAADCGVQNVSIVPPNRSSIQLIQDSDLILLDYPCTTLLQALSFQHPRMAIFIPDSCRTNPRTEERLMSAFNSALKPEDWPKVVEDSVTDLLENKPTSPQKLKLQGEFLKLHGLATDQPYESVKAILSFVFRGVF